MTFAIRPFHPSDLTALYRICLLTGDAGGDASHRYGDPDLLGHYYAAPYALLEPDLCFVLTAAGRPVGYILGTRDSAAFAGRCERDWFPPLRDRYPLPDPTDVRPDAQLIRLIHEGYRPVPDLAAYPAHLHIDLLPEAQGRGQGRALMARFLGHLRALGVPAVHLGVSQENSGAIAFYERVGFHRIQEAPWGLYLGLALHEGC